MYDPACTYVHLICIICIMWHSSMHDLYLWYLNCLCSAYHTVCFPIGSPTGMFAACSYMQQNSSRNTRVVHGLIHVMVMVMASVYLFMYESECVIFIMCLLFVMCVSLSGMHDLCLEVSTVTRVEVFFLGTIMYHAVCLDTDAVPCVCIFSEGLSYPSPRGNKWQRMNLLIKFSLHWAGIVTLCLAAWVCTDSFFCLYHDLCAAVYLWKFMHVYKVHVLHISYDFQKHSY